MLKLRSVLAIASLWIASLYLASQSAQAKDLELPDIGRSASAGISEREEYYYSLSVLRELRNAGILIEDPQVEEYFRTLGTRLTEASSKPDENFRFVVLNDPEFNAFAVPGGLIAVHTGLIMHAASESELAAVLAHEAAHVTQKHSIRALERTKQASIPVLLGTLALVAAAASQDRSNNVLRNPGTIDPVEAALIGGSALMQQLQINYTRDNEFEADRIGIQTLKKAGFDVTAMAGMFQRMQRTFRSSGGARAPQYLQTHPISVTRIAEAKSRAASLLEQPRPHPDMQYLLMRERIRVLQNADTTVLERYYRETIASRGGASPALIYGQALAFARSGSYAKAHDLAKQLPADPQIKLTRELLSAEIAVAAKNQAQWRPHYLSLLQTYPKHRVVGAQYAQALIDMGTKKDANEALEILRELVSAFDSDPALFEQLGRAYQLSGDSVRAGEAYARATALRGNLEDALGQLQRMASGPNLDYYQRARIDAQVAELTPIVLEIRKRDGTANQGEQLSTDTLR